MSSAPSRAEPQLVEVEYLVHQLPVRVIEVIDWSKVCDMLDAGQEPCFEMTPSLSRSCYMWAKTNRGYHVYYRATPLKGVLQLTKKPTKKLAGPSDQRRFKSGRKGD